MEKNCRMCSRFNGVDEDCRGVEANARGNLSEVCSHYKYKKGKNVKLKPTGSWGKETARIKGIAMAKKGFFVSVDSSNLSNGRGIYYCKERKQLRYCSVDFVDCKKSEEYLEDVTSCVWVPMSKVKIIQPVILEDFTSEAEDTMELKDKKFHFECRTMTMKQALKLFKFLGKCLDYEVE